MLFIRVIRNKYYVNYTRSRIFCFVELEIIILLEAKMLYRIVKLVS